MTWPTSDCSASYQDDVLWPVSAHANETPLVGMGRSGTPRDRIQLRRSSVPELGHGSDGATFHAPRLMNPQFALLLKSVALLSYQ